MDFHEIWMSHGPDKAFNILINYSGNDAHIFIKKKEKKKKENKKKSNQNQKSIYDWVQRDCAGLVEVWSPLSSIF